MDKIKTQNQTLRGLQFISISNLSWSKDVTNILDGVLMSLLKKFG